MAELLLELLSEEIPARMQAGGAAELARLLGGALAALSPEIETFWGPRRIAAVAQVAAEVPAVARVERGPRLTAPEAALAGFVRKHGAAREALVAEGDYWVLHLASPARPAAALIGALMPGLLRGFGWPKSMRWGESSFTWVRPLRRILCLLDGAVVKFDLRAGDDDGHGLASGDLSEGHRFLAPGVVAVRSAEGWREDLLNRRVVVRAAERRARIADGVAGLAAARELTVVADEGLLDEVAGLVEWPVPLLGRIDDGFMDLPAEVMQVSMRVNQRYFALRTAEGAAAPWFGFVANIVAADGGAAIVAGNERVLRARFSDARHFWDLDRTRRLDSRVAALESVTFHAKLGTQADRARRLAALAPVIATAIGADPKLAARAALLAKADLTTGMVGEFPELQGVMGGYYAARDEEDQEVARAIREHYLPRGWTGPVPSSPVAVAVALADKIELLVGFFKIRELPTGSSDPFALRRAALGILNIVRQKELDVGLHSVILACDNIFDQEGRKQPFLTDPLDVLEFILERLAVKMRSEGRRHDIVKAVVITNYFPCNILRLMRSIESIEEFLAGEAGRKTHGAYKRARNLLSSVKGSSHKFETLKTELMTIDELELHQATQNSGDYAYRLWREGSYVDALYTLAHLHVPLTRMMDNVRVMDSDPTLQNNRLRLLDDFCSVVDRLADFSKIEG